MVASGNPVAEVGSADFLQKTGAVAIAGGQAVVVNQDMEAILLSIPNVPDKRPVVEQLAVLLEGVPQPIFEGGVAMSGRGQEFPLGRGEVPLGTISVLQQSTQTIGSSLLPVNS